MNSGLRTLICGFYDRGNLGDESYKLVLRELFPNASFVCTDDIQEVPSGFDIVVCGGGDIITSYFMDKVKIITKNYNGPLYAFSVGIPFESEADSYLSMFDHVFVRTKTDYDVAKRLIGERNVTYLPDAALLLPKMYNISKPPLLPKIKDIKKSKIGLCLANPIVREVGNTVFKAFEQCFMSLQKYFKCSVTLIPFNTFEVNHEECDLYANDRFLNYFQERGVKWISHVKPSVAKDPKQVMRIMSDMDIIIGMRLHSIIFSYACQKNFVALCKTRKMQNFLKDINCTESGIDLDEANIGEKLTELVCRQLLVPKIADGRVLQEARVEHYKYVLCQMYDTKKYQSFLSKRLISSCVPSLEQVLAFTKHMLEKYFSIENDSWENMLLGKYDFNELLLSPAEALVFARIVCYAASRNVNSPCIWGLSENVMKEDFVLKDAIDYIYHFHNSSEKQNWGAAKESYIPSLPSVIDRTFALNMDYLPRDDYSAYHRSGWSYVTSGLYNYNASFRNKIDHSRNIILDTYIDRTFHWAADVFKIDHLIPYKQPWIGFVHHTFDETHSNHNCTVLFEKEEFIESLQCCKGLIVFSEYLEWQVKLKLADIGYKHIPVRVLVHPTEQVENKFTFEAFMNNPDKKVVQIGAWLRNPYAIYELPLYKEHTNTNPLRIRKVALKGKDMDEYFKPCDFFERLTKLFCDCNKCSGGGQPGSGRICRGGKGSNKYIVGCLKMLMNNDSSVKVINKLTNEEYDDLLCRNIVFLNLVDCSAVNTVIECIVRETVIIVNRHPALVEMLGRDYPGFYEDMVEAGMILGNETRLRCAYNHLHNLDKSRFSIENFLTSFNEVVSTMIKN